MVNKQNLTIISGSVITLAGIYFWCFSELLAFGVSATIAGTIVLSFAFIDKIPKE